MMLPLALPFTGQGEIEAPRKDEPMLRITYETITPESAEHSDAAERGFMVCPDSWGAFSAPLAIADQYSERDKQWTVRQAEQFLGRHGMEDSGHWFTGEGSTDYRTGAETRYSLHPSGNITAASYDRLRRIFC